MSHQKTFYNPEIAAKVTYTEKWKMETVTVKEISDLHVLHHYWQDAAGELWGDFDDPMENVRSDFQAYRQRKNYLAPQDIVTLRKKLNLTVRQFASKLGLSSSTLSQIENDQRIQTRYQDNLFRWASGEKFTTNTLTSEDA